MLYTIFSVIKVYIVYIQDCKKKIIGLLIIYVSHCAFTFTQMAINSLVKLSITIVRLKIVSPI